MKALNRRGTTLIELVAAVGVSSVVAMGMTDVTLQMARSQLAASRTRDAVGASADAVKLIEREAAQATIVTSPAAGGADRSKLEGCSNAMQLPGQDAPVPVDRSRPMRWFAFCRSRGRLRYHAGLLRAGESCPAAYACGASALMSFEAAASFSRPARASELDFSLTTAAGDQSIRTGGAVALLEAQRQ